MNIVEDGLQPHHVIPDVDNIYEARSVIDKILQCLEFIGLGDKALHVNTSEQIRLDIGMRS